MLLDSNRGRRPAAEDLVSGKPLPRHSHYNRLAAIPLAPPQPIFISDGIVSGHL